MRRDAVLELLDRVAERDPPAGCEAHHLPGAGGDAAAPQTCTPHLTDPPHARRSCATLLRRGNGQDSGCDVEGTPVSTVAIGTVW